MSTLRQILPLFVLPVGICVMLTIGGLVLRRRWMIWGSLLILWLSSSSLASAPLMRATEGWAERIPAASASNADAIVVLSTGRIVAPGPAAISEWTDPDRFFAGVELYHAGKARLVVFTGAPSSSAASAPLEGDVLARHARVLGVPGDRVLVTRRIVNTEDEAREVAALLTRPPVPTRILLVTSAFHMPRARRLFERAGLAVTPFPVDFRQPVGGSLGVADFLPNATALAQTQIACREIYGRLFYLVFPSR